MSKHEDLARFYHRMGIEGCGFATATSILRNARTIQRLAETACNRELTPREHKREDNAGKNIVALVATLGKGWRVKLGGDPRGYCVKLILPSGEHNTWGGAEEGWGVPA